MCKIKDKMIDESMFGVGLPVLTERCACGRRITQIADQERGICAVCNPDTDRSASPRIEQIKNGWGDNYPATFNPCIFN